MGRRLTVFFWSFFFLLILIFIFFFFIFTTFCACVCGCGKNHLSSVARAVMNKTAYLPNCQDNLPTPIACSAMLHLKLLAFRDGDWGEPPAQLAGLPTRRTARSRIGARAHNLVGSPACPAHGAQGVPAGGLVEKPLIHWPPGPWCTRSVEHCRLDAWAGCFASPPAPVPTQRSPLHPAHPTQRPSETQDPVSAYIHKTSINYKL